MILNLNIFQELLLVINYIKIGNLLELLKKLSILYLIQNLKNTKKHISSNYLLNTIENRYKLLAGLIDSDGFKIKNKNQYEISSKYESLIEDILILTKSLGLKSYSFKKFNKTYNTFYYYIVFTGNNCKKYSY